MSTVQHHILELARSALGPSGSTMKKTILFIFLLTCKTLSLETPKSEMEYKEGTAVDPKYSLPQVNLSVSDGNHTVVPASLARVLNFYNSELLAANWHRTKDQISSTCRKDVELYLEGLRKTDNWALKSKCPVVWGNVFSWRNDIAAWLTFSGFSNKETIIVGTRNTYVILLF